MTSRRPRFAILASGRGSNAARLMDVFEEGIGADLVLVLCDVPGALVLDLAESRGYPTEVVPFRDGRDAHEDEVLVALAEHGVHHALLAGYMRILSPGFLSRFGGTILNVHPSLLPDFPGLDAAARQWEAGVAVAGATVHVVDEGVDSGPIVAQGSLTVNGDEGPDGLARRILTEVEHRIYPQALRFLVADLVADEPAAPGAVATALLSVADKTGIVDLARRLSKCDVALLASGGTAAALEEAGVAVTRVEEVTGAGELLGGRVKTLHPHLHAAILADRRDDGHVDELGRLGIRPIDLVVGSPYPFAAAVAASPTRRTAVEHIDIGGPALIRAAAKNADGGVSVVTGPDDYPLILSWLEKGLPVPPMVRRLLAARAFALTADYDRSVAAWADPGIPDEPALRAFTAVRSLRYGENPHQRARLLVDASGRGVAAGMLLHGKPLSHNNLLDLDAAYRVAYGDGPHRCAVIKHTNPCGLAEAASQSSALHAAISGDPVAAFGSVIGFNRPVEEATARALIDSGLFVECIAAPGFDDGALAVLRTRRKLRLLDVSAADPTPAVSVHAVGGGLLVQGPDPGPSPETWEVVTERGVDAARWDELRFAMRAVAALTSNAVCVTRDRTLRGVGAGMVSRIDACRLALEKAGDHAAGAVLASDGFFPFDDGVRLAAAAGIDVVVQPGGSIRDAEVIDACDELGLAMVFTGRRHFRH
jgi:phosphoribosylaminoimidazolecarboxamide formyltransferase / IMP cyclohydrolase